MSGVDGLYQNDPGHIAAPRSARRLRQQLERALRGAEIRQPRPISADITPTRVTLGMSWPLAIICVPTRMSNSFRENPEGWFRNGACRPPYRGPCARCAPGKFAVQFVFDALASDPNKLNIFALHLGQTLGTRSA